MIVALARVSGFSRNSGLGRAVIVRVPRCSMVRLMGALFQLKPVVCDMGALRDCMACRVSLEWTFLAERAEEGVCYVAGRKSAGNAELLKG